MVCDVLLTTTQRGPPIPCVSSCDETRNHQICQTKLVKECLASRLRG
jgi:hypothetical protein